MAEEEDKIPEKPDIKDNISVCDSELSMSSHGTNDSYERSQNSKPVGRKKKVSLIRGTFAVPEPDVVAGRIKSDSEVIYEASVSQKVRYFLSEMSAGLTHIYYFKIVDEFLLSDSDNEEARPRRGLNAYYLNNYNIGDPSSPGIPTERPQRRKRSLEERHPDFVLDLPSKKSGIKYPGRSVSDQNIRSSSENNEI